MKERWDAGAATGFVLFVGSERAAFWTGALGVAAMTAQPFQYLRFLGISLETPLVAPFRGRFGSAALFGFAGLFGFVAAIHAYFRTKPGSAARDRAKWFAIAFGARDAYFGVMLSLYPVIRPIEFWGDFVYNSGAPNWLTGWPQVS